MRTYELVFLTHPDMLERRGASIERALKIIEKDGTIHRSEDIGRRTLAYEMQRLHKADYYLVNFSCAHEAREELDEMLRVSDVVVRHMIVRREDELESGESQLLMQVRAEREGRQSVGDTPDRNDRDSDSDSDDAEIGVDDAEEGKES